MISAFDHLAHEERITRAHHTFWAIFDASLLTLIVTLSADMLGHLRSVQSLLWLLCYALISLRIATVWLVFFQMLLLNWVVILYPAMCLLSVLWSVNKGATLSASLQLSMTVIMGMYLGWRYSLGVLIKALCVILTIGVSLSILHWAAGIFPWPVYTRTGGLAGLFSSKNMLGLRALFAIIASVTILMMQRNEVGSSFRAFAMFALIVNVFAVSLSLSMTSVLLLPVMLAVLSILCWHRMPTAMISTGLLVIIAVLSIGPVMLVITGINPVEAILSAIGKSSTLTGRVYIWQVATEVYRENPIFGVGYQAFWHSSEFLREHLLIQDAGALTSNSFHSFPLEILVSAGWPALMAMGALLWLATARLLALFHETRSAAVAGAITLLAGIVLSSLVGTSLYRAHEIMIILVVAFAVSAGEDLARVRCQSKKDAVSP